MSYKCTGFKKFDHSIQSCRYRNKIQSYNDYTNLTNDNNYPGQNTTNSTNNSNISNTQFEHFLNMITPLINNSINNTIATNSVGNKLRAITVNPNGGYTTTG